MYSNTVTRSSFLQYITAFHSTTARIFWIDSCLNFSFFFFFLFFNWRILLSNVVLVSAIQHESAIGIHMSPLSLNLPKAEVLTCQPLSLHPIFGVTINVTATQTSLVVPKYTRHTSAFWPPSAWNIPTPESCMANSLNCFKIHSIACPMRPILTNYLKL